MPKQFCNDLLFLSESDGGRGGKSADEGAMLRRACGEVPQGDAAGKLRPMCGEDCFPCRMGERLKGERKRARSDRS